MTTITYNPDKTLIATHEGKLLHTTNKKEYKYLFTYWYDR